MRTQADILKEMEQLIPSDLWQKYQHLSFGEMSELPDMAKYSDALREAEAGGLLAEHAEE